MTDPSTLTARRELLKSLAIGIPTIGLTDTVAAHRADTGNIRHTKPEHNTPDTENFSAHRLLLSLRYGALQENTYWWLQGRRYAAIDNELIPLFDIWVGFAYRRSPLDDSADRIDIRSRVLYTALDSDQLLSTWHNPVSRKLVNFSYSEPTTQVYRYIFDKGLERPALGLDTQQEREDLITGVRQIENRLYLDEEARVKVFHPRSPEKSPRKVHDRYMWSGTLLDSNKSFVNFVDAEVSFMDLTDWSPRLEMGNTPGCAIAHCSGHRTVTLDSFPKTWHALHARHQLGTLAFDKA